MAHDDEDSRAIIARRNRFIAIALAGMTTACGSDPEPPEPQPCLSVVPDTNGEETPEVPPQPCLSPVPDPEPEPQPCLSVAAPDDEES
jgi:hypothetical protein